MGIHVERHAGHGGDPFRGALNESRPVCEPQFRVRGCGLGPDKQRWATAGCELYVCRIGFGPVKAQVSTVGQTDCKSVGLAFEGSNPSPATSVKQAPELQVCQG